MVHLVPPDGERHSAWRACLLELAGRPVHGSGYFGPDHRRSLDPAPFAVYVADRLAAEDPEAPVPDGWVRCSYRWVVGSDWDDAGPLLGFVAIRHGLTPGLFDLGGHVGYTVRPSARGRGVATAALRLAVTDAHAAGVDPVLVMCEPDNGASRTVIERAGGVRECLGGGHLRYWFGSGPRPGRPPG